MSSEAGFLYLGPPTTNKVSIMSVSAVPEACSPKTCLWKGTSDCPDVSTEVISKLIIDIRQSSLASVLSV